MEIAKLKHQKVNLKQNYHSRKSGNPSLIFKDWNPVFTGMKLWILKQVQDDEEKLHKLI
jgi:hypothetical protein